MDSLHTNQTLALAHHAHSIDVAALPPAVLLRAKQVIIDELLSSFFCARSLAGDLTANYAAAASGAPEATIYARVGKVSAVNAALANGAAGHGEEVDGAHVVGGHPGASIVHACIAMAERQRATGADLIAAVVAGYDIGVRLVEACGGLFGVKERFKLNSDFLYAYGCAAGAGKLLGLDPVRIGHAMTLVGFNTNALANFYAERRHISKSLCNGQFASAGVQAALMASYGLEGHDDSIGSEYGLLHAWGDPARKSALAAGLGRDFSILGANIKFINAGYPIHSAVEAAMKAYRESGLAPDDIDSVEVGMPTASRRVVDSRTMHNICLQDMLAAALLEGGLNLGSTPFPGILSHPDFAKLRAGITLVSSPELDRDQPNGRGSIVTITGKGKKATARVNAARGHASLGATDWSELHQKWREGLPSADIGAIFHLAESLEHLEDASQLVAVATARR